MKLSARDLRTTVVIPAGHVLTVVADAISAGTLGGVEVSASSSASAGPFAVDTPYVIECTAGVLVHSCQLFVEERAAAGVLWLHGEGPPVDYTDGDPAATGQDAAATGSLYSDITAGELYINGGTAAEPTWSQLAKVA